MMYGKPYSGPRWPGFDRVGVFIMGLVALGLYAFLILLVLWGLYNLVVEVL